MFCEFVKNCAQHMQHMQRVAQALQGKSATHATLPFRECCMLQPEKGVALPECVNFYAMGATA